ncbi:hypothetical protein KUV80_14150 [Fictibacillus nanhaiensis]|uniref:hypothetical protein n=1 Tax=Fictibacillus nanhaiensis TaxID=742169 RepID=UPI001C955B56|nr:hypothetical protein [Fictibacillus nanhaiensis]MBY6037810.1 hypothetical protein [Fictibacillus nanhaiensis]
MSILQTIKHLIQQEIRKLLCLIDEKLKKIEKCPGPPGPPGPPGTFSPVYANIFDNANQVLVRGTNERVRFNQFNQPQSVIFGGITATATSLTVPVAGDYSVLWETVFLPIPGQQHAAFGIFVNGTLQDSTRSGSAAFSDQQFNIVSSVSILSLAAGDTLELRLLIPATSTQTTVNLNATIQYPPFNNVANQPINSASLRIFKLGPT